MSPRLAYCYGLATIARCLAETDLPKEHAAAQRQLLDMLYKILRKTESWSDSNFGNHLHGILDELDNEEIPKQVVKVFKEIGERWSTKSDAPI